MGKQEAVTEPDSGEPGTGGPPAAPSPDGPGGATGPAVRPRQPARRLLRLNRTRRLALISVAAVLAVAATVIGITTTSGGQPRRASLAQAKNFSLQVLGHPGQRLSLASLAGKPVIVNFFASWCHPCQQETPLLARYYRSTGGKTAIIGIDTNDQTPAALKFLKAKGVSYPVAADPAAATAIAYGVAALGIPQTFFLNARHQIVKHIYGAVTLAELSSGTALMTKPAKRG